MMRLLDLVQAKMSLECSEEDAYLRIESYGFTTAYGEVECLIKGAHLPG